MADTDELMSAAERAAMAELNEMDAPAAEDAPEALPPAEEKPEPATDKADKPEETPNADKPAEAPATEPAAPPVAEAPAAPEAPALAVDPVAEDVDDDEPVYLPVTDVAPLKESLTKAEADLEAIAAKLEAGDISASEAFRESNKLNAQIAELRADIKGSEQAVKANQAAAERYVDRSLKRFMTDDDNKKLYQKDSPAWKAMDAALKTVSAMPENATKSYAWMLREADRIARAMVNAPRKPAEAPAAQAPAPAPAKPKPTADRTKTTPVPVTLASLPAAGQESIESEFAYIDNLSGVEREKAIAKLKPEEYERYLACVY